MIELTLKDRYEIVTLLPQKGDLLTIGIVKAISEKVAVTPEESAQYAVTSVGQCISWNDEGKNALFPIDFTAPELQILKGEIKTLNDKREIPVTMYELCMKINNAEILKEVVKK